MDKKSLLGFVLIGIVLMIWLYWNSSTQQDAMKKSIVQADSIQQLQKRDSIVTPVLTKDTTSKDTSSSSKSNIVDSVMQKSGSLFYGQNIFSGNTEKEKVIMLESDKLLMEFTNYGGCIKKYTIKDYETWDKKPLQLKE